MDFPTQSAVKISRTAGGNNQQHTRAGVLGTDVQSWDGNARLKWFAVFAQPILMDAKVRGL